MIHLDTEHIKERNKWEDEIAELERQIELYREESENNNSQSFWSKFWTYFVLLFILVK